MKEIREEACKRGENHDHIPPRCFHQTRIRTAELREGRGINLKTPGQVKINDSRNQRRRKRSS